MSTEAEVKQATADAMQELAASTIGQVMSIYATMVYGQIVGNEAIPYDHKLAAVLAAHDVLEQAHVQAFNALRAGPDDVPAWGLTPDKTRDIAGLYARYMTQGK